ncbi:MAG: sensor histidine kinase, partial [Planctomycetota bacterium]
LMRESLAFDDPPGEFISLHVTLEPQSTLTCSDIPEGAPPSSTQALLEDLRRRPEFSRALRDIPLIPMIDPPPQQVVAKNDMRQSVQQSEYGDNDYNKRYYNTKGITNQSMSKVSQVADVVEARPVPPMNPLWAGDTLVLARRRQDRIEASVVDFKSLTQHLEGLIDDLFPNARILKSGPQPDLNLSLASLPLTLDIGNLPGPTSPPIQNGLRQSLWLAWGGLGLAGLASGLLLLASQKLSTKRRDFVTAVTHELRTPLTSLRLHTDLMADNRTPSESRAEHFTAIKDAADRLAHLVENVLSYSRLERGRRASKTQLTVQDLLDSPLKAIGERMTQAGFAFTCTIPPELMKIRVETDPGAVARILFNLADNALKYASIGARFKIEASLEDRFVILKASDAGPGLPQSSRVFQPFRKSAQKAAMSAPGVGLGLPMSLRLARDLGGFLEHDKDHHPGTCWVLGIPVMRQS